MLDHPHNSWFSRSLQIHEPIQLHMTEIMNHLQNREPLPNPSAPAPWPQPHQKNAINQILEITSECNTIMKWQNNTPETREIDRSVVETRQLRHGCRVSSSLRPKTIGVRASTIRLGFLAKDLSICPSLSSNVVAAITVKRIKQQGFWATRERQWSIAFGFEKGLEDVDSPPQRIVCAT